MQFSDVRATSIELTGFPSVTNSPGETAFVPFLAGKIAAMDYFRTRPGDLVVEKTPDDPCDRSVLFAFVRGSGTECLILTGHYDVVSTACYGELETLAFKPEELTRKLAEELAHEGKGANDSRARSDLESGAFLAGRGLLDMKSGLAAGLSVLERFAADPERAGNILFLAVPDEEDSSHGMRYAASRIKDFLSTRGCEAVAAINLDSAVDQDSGEAGRAMFLGSVGKLLPFVLFVGRATHAGAPFDGINPALLAAAFVRRVESDPEGLGEDIPENKPDRAPMPDGNPASDRDPAPDHDMVKDEVKDMVKDVPPPPTVLYLREMRASYNVTTPSSVFCALNVLSHTRSPASVLSRLKTLAAESMEEALSLLVVRARTQSERSGSIFSPPDRPPVVLDYAALAATAARAPVGKAAPCPSGDAQTDPVVRAATVAEELAIRCGVEGPAALVGFAPPYYPRAEFTQGRDDWFLKILEDEAARMASETGESIRLRPFFPGISDMSHLAPSDGPGQAEYVAARSPLAQPATGGGIGCPVVNIGPWGRDYHQRLERVHVRYSFTVLPELLWRIACAVSRRN